VTSSDLIVVGGGLVGAALAYGAARTGASVTVLDGADDAFRASRGNFGLVWVQGKGYGMTPYIHWTLRSTADWPRLAATLLAETGVDVQLQQPGGIHFFFSEEEMRTRQERLQRIRDDVGAGYSFRILDRSALLQMVPSVGPQVLGASYSPMDGHANPLKLLRALHMACRGRGVRFHSGVAVTRIARDGGAWQVEADGQRWLAPRVALAAGLGNRELAAQVGLRAPVTPLRGQLLIGERVARFLDYPTLLVRQTDEGTVQCGDSQEEVGFDDGTRPEVLSDIARRAVRSFPALRNMRLVRAWGALRVMSPDGYPIYQESATHPGAFVVTCHSGVTLAANHVFSVAPWLTGDPAPAGIAPFTGDRFAPSQKSYQHVRW
jgi:glycine/D-amino acid oxidase-like deaminating enzyme